MTLTEQHRSLLFYSNSHLLLNKSSVIGKHFEHLEMHQSYQLSLPEGFVMAGNVSQQHLQISAKQELIKLRAAHAKILITY